MLKLAKVPPIVKVNSVGRGTRKKRKKIGNNKVINTLWLKRIRVMPMMKMGSEKR